MNFETLGDYALPQLQRYIQRYARDHKRKPIGRNLWLVDRGDFASVKYYFTDIIEIHDDHLVVRHAGWKTQATHRRLWYALPYLGVSLKVISCGPHRNEWGLRPLNEHIEEIMAVPVTAEGSVVKPGDLPNFDPDKLAVCWNEVLVEQYGTSHVRRFRAERQHNRAQVLGFNSNFATYGYPVPTDKDEVYQLRRLAGNLGFKSVADAYARGVLITLDMGELEKELVRAGVYALSEQVIKQEFEVSFNRRERLQIFERW